MEIFVERLNGKKETVKGLAGLEIFMSALAAEEMQKWELTLEKV